MFGKEAHRFFPSTCRGVRSWGVYRRSFRHLGNLGKQHLIGLTAHLQVQPYHSLSAVDTLLINQPLLSLSLNGRLLSN